MRGVKFGNFHSYDDFSLILNSKEIEAPSAKTETVEIPGADGVLDLSEYFGEVRYNNRKLSFEFSTIVPQSQFLNLFSEIQNEIHGKKLKIILDDDPDFYYYGRVTLDKWKADKNIGKISIDCDCEPYKYKLYETQIVNTVEYSATLVYKNLRKSVVPTISLSADAQITFENTIYSMSAGTYTSSEILFKAGNNLLIVTGNTTITVKYQEGGL